MRIFVSAAEISSDLQAEKILRALIELNPGHPVEIYGIGGPRIRSIPGFQAIAHAESMRVMGLIEVLSQIPRLRKIQDSVVDHLESTPPDVILTFDYPDFHLSLMKRLSTCSWYARALKVCGIPPKVWVWRRGRVKKIRALYDGVWVIFPFEKNFYETQGIPVIYEGNPLIADLFRERFQKVQLETEDQVSIAVFPGSRDAELKHHLPLIGPTLSHLARLSEKRIFAEVPIPTGIASDRIERELVSDEHVQYAFIKGGATQVLGRNSIGLIKSGTSTLEAAVLGCVPVIYYKLNPLSEWFFKRFVGYLGPVGLPNILLGVKDRAHSVFKEFLGVEAKPDLLAVEMHRLIQDASSREELKASGESLKAELVPHVEVSREVARKLLAWIQNRPAQTRLERTRSVWIALASHLWSRVNQVRRAARKFGAREAPKIPVKSILVGNLQAGGAGKTPMVIALAKEAIRRGYTVGVVTRGYGGSYSVSVHLVTATDPARVIGDEPAEMMKAVPALKIAVSKDRMKASRLLMSQGVNLVIADDGFQNLGFRTDLTILMVTDAARNEAIYRDFDSAAKRADFVFQSKGQRSARFQGAIELDWEVESIPKGPVWIWTAIGDPVDLVQFYTRRGLKADRLILKRDHEAPIPAELAALIEEARVAGARVAITEKDAVKFPAELRHHCLILRRSLRIGRSMNAIFERLQ